LLENLNISGFTGETDQFGRPLHGRLETQFGLLYSAGRSNGRFHDYGPVWSANPDGWSSYAGATVTLERSSENGVDAFASYTLSRTRDNVHLGTISDGSIAYPVQQPSLGNTESEDWMEATSVFDRPHRLVAGFSAPVPSTPLRLSLLYG